MDGEIYIKSAKRKTQSAKLVGFIFLLFFLFLFLPTKAFAQGAAPSIKIRYEAEYLLGKQGDAKVEFKIKIKNLRSDIYVKKFGLSFPSNFKIYNLKGYGNKDELKPKLEEKGDRLFVQVELENPSIGKGTENNIRLEFLQKRLVRVEGNIWEIILPTVERKGKEVESYAVKVILPENFSKKLSLSKPEPTYVKGKTIYWKDVKSRIVYAVLGSPQYYKVNLRYAVENPKIAPVFVFVAFPPDTLYQKVLVQNITPKPAEVKIDEDGNYLGKYFLKPKERLEVNFDGYIAVFSQPRKEYLEILPSEFEKQKPYLLRESKYWRLGERTLDIVQRDLSDKEKARRIFEFVIQKLDYNFKKVNQRKIQRLGAELALKNPKQAVCTEFSDVFVALARENGVFAREVQGYGYAQDKRFRPLSLVGDVLHAWPEYWDNQIKLWVPIDPTWQDTSGIDYFSSLDFNHIVFVIHGKNDSFPLPAGAYKLEDRKDILITPVKVFPKSKEKILVRIIRSGIFKEKYLFQGQKEDLIIQLENKGNSFLLGTDVKIESEGLNLSKTKFYLLKLAPFQKKEFKILAVAQKEGKAKIVLELNNRVAAVQEFQIKPLWYKYFLFFLQNYLYFGLIFILIFLPLVYFFRR